MEQWQYKPAGDFGLSANQRYQSIRRESGLVSSLTRHAWWIGMRGYMRVWHRMTIIGAEHLPRDPPFVMIANHGSHLDTMALAAALPIRLREHAFPIAAGDTFFQTTLKRSFSAFMLNALPMWRKNCGRHALADLRTRLLDEGCVFILFPEGTRTRDGRMIAFKAGIGMLIAETPVQIVPCHLSGSFDALPPGRSIPGMKKITLRIGEPICFGGVSNDRQGWKRIAEESHDRVKALGPAMAKEASLRKTD